MSYDNMMVMNIIIIIITAITTTATINIIVHMTAWLCMKLQTWLHIWI